MKNKLLFLIAIGCVSCFTYQRDVKVNHDDYRDTKVVTMERVYQSEEYMRCSFCLLGRYDIRARYSQESSASEIATANIYFTIVDPDPTVEGLRQEVYLKIDSEITQLTPLYVDFEIAEKTETDDDDGSISTARSKIHQCKIEIPKDKETLILGAKHVSYRFYSGAETYTAVLSNYELQKLRTFIQTGRQQYSGQL